MSSLTSSGAVGDTDVMTHWLATVGLHYTHMLRLASVLLDTDCIVTLSACAMLVHLTDPRTEAKSVDPWICGSPGIGRSEQYGPKLKSVYSRTKIKIGIFAVWRYIGDFSQKSGIYR